MGGSIVGQGGGPEDGGGGTAGGGGDSGSAPPLTIATATVDTTPGAVTVPNDFFGAAEPQTNVGPWAGVATYTSHAGPLASPDDGPLGENTIYRTLYAQIAKNLGNPIFFRLEGDYQHPTLWECNNEPQLYAKPWPDGNNGSSQACSGIMTATTASGGSEYTSLSKDDRFLVVEGTQWNPIMAFGYGAHVWWNGSVYVSTASGNAANQPDADVKARGGHWTPLRSGGAVTVTGVSGGAATVAALGGQGQGLGYSNGLMNLPTVPLSIANAVPISAWTTDTAGHVTFTPSGPLPSTGTVTIYGCTAALGWNGLGGPVTISTANHTFTLAQSQTTVAAASSSDTCKYVPGSGLTVNVSETTHDTLNWPQSAVLEPVYELATMHLHGIPFGCVDDDPAGCTIGASQTPYLTFTLPIDMATAQGSGAYSATSCNNLGVTPTTTPVPCFAGTLAKNWVAELGSSFQGFEIGNEPDNYPGQGYRPNNWGAGNLSATYNDVATSNVCNGGAANGGWWNDFCGEEQNIYQTTGTHFRYLNPSTAGNLWRATVDPGLAYTPENYVHYYSQHSYPFGKAPICPQAPIASVSADAEGWEYVTLSQPAPVAHDLPFTGASVSTKVNSNDASLGGSSYTVTLDLPQTTSLQDWLAIVSGGRIVVTFDAADQANGWTGPAATGIVWSVTGTTVPTAGPGPCTGCQLTYTIPKLPGTTTTIAGGTFSITGAWMNVAGAGLGANGTSFDADSIPKGGEDTNQGHTPPFDALSCAKATSTTGTCTLFMATSSQPTWWWPGATMTIDAGNFIGTGVYRIDTISAATMNAQSGYQFTYTIPYATSSPSSTPSGTVGNVAYSQNYDEVADHWAVLDPMYNDLQHWKFQRNLPIAENVATAPPGAFASFVSGSKGVGGKLPNAGPTCNPANLLLERASTWKTIMLNAIESHQIHNGYLDAWGNPIEYRIGEQNFMSPAQSSLTNAAQMPIAMVDLFLDYLDWRGTDGDTTKGGTRVPGFDGFNWFQGATTLYDWADQSRQNKSGVALSYSMANGESCTDCGVHAGYYGSYVASLMLQAGSRPLHVTQASAANISVHAVRTQESPVNHVRVAILNKDLAVSGNVSVSVPGYATANQYTLTGTSYDAYAVLDAFAVANGGAGCSVGDVLELSPPGDPYAQLTSPVSPARLKVTSVNQGVVTAMTQVAGHLGSGFVPSGQASSTTGVSSTCTQLPTVTVQSVKSGLVYAGMTFDGSKDGTPVGTATPTTIAGSGGVFTVSVPVASITILDVYQ